MPTSPPTERRAAAVTITLAACAFLMIRLLAPRAFETADEAKYVGLGLDILAGKGLVTVFGLPFPNHSPVWPLILAIPQSAGIDGIWVGQTINALSATAAIALSGALGWRVRPAVGALAAVSLLGFPYLLTLSRTAGIDLPAAALTLGYLVVGLWAMDRGSIRGAIGAGALFGLAFLIKETALPFAPIPFLAGLAWGRPWPRLARQGAVTLLMAAAILSWWFVLHAEYTGVVYRLGAPSWLLGPLGLVVMVLVLAGWFVEPLMARRAGPTTGDPPSSSHWPIVVAWIGGICWATLQFVVYARAPKLTGAGFVRLSAMTFYLHYVPQLAGAMAFVVPGGILTLIAAVARRLGPQAWRELFPIVMTLIAEVPLILLVIAIGETPRHYVAIFPVLAVAASIGWVSVGEAAWHGARWARVGLAVGVVVGAPFAILALRRVAPVVRTLPVPFLVAGLAVVLGLFVIGWLARRGGPSRAWIAPLLALVLLVGAGSLAGATAARPTPADAAKQAAADTAAGWIHDHVPPGATIGVTARLGYETARRIAGEHPVVRLRPRSGTVAAEAPVGLHRAGGDGDFADPVVATSALYNGDLLDVWSADDLAQALRDDRPSYWVVHTLGTGDQPLPTMLESTPGITKVASWAFPSGSQEDRVAVFAIDPDAVMPDPRRLYVDRTALERIISRLEGSGAGVGPAADALRQRVTITPASDEDAGLLARLDALHGR